MLWLSQYKRKYIIFNVSSVYFSECLQTPFTHAATEKLFQNQFISGIFLK